MLVNVTVWADKVKWAAKQSRNLRENGGSIGSTGPEIDVIYVFSGKSAHLSICLHFKVIPATIEPT